MQIFNNANLLAKAVWRGLSPKPAAMLQIPLSFATDAFQQVTLDMGHNTTNKFGIAGIQSVKIDNSLNGSPLIVTFDNGDVIYAPQYTQGIYPVFYSGNTLSFIANCSIGSTAKLTFLNTREQAQIWAAGYPIQGTVNVTGSVVNTAPQNGSMTDVSAALATAGAPQVLVAANPYGRVLAIRNPATAMGQNIAAPEPVYLSFAVSNPVVGGLGTWELLPGEQFPQLPKIDADAIYWVAATAGHRLTAKYM
jgi:hypothetical protein